VVSNGTPQVVKTHYKSSLVGGYRRVSPLTVII
jgi:hypothetical protein